MTRVLTMTLIAATLPPPVAAAVVTASDSIVSGVCEGGILPIGIVAPPGRFHPGCHLRYVLRAGPGDGARGWYGFVVLPPCDPGPCGSAPSADRLGCELLNGNACCFSWTLVGQELPIVHGTRTGPYVQAFAARWGSDTDQRSGICHDEYVGNGKRILQVLVLEPSSDDRKSLRVAGYATFFLRDLPRFGLDDLVGELVRAP